MKVANNDSLLKIIDKNLISDSSIGIHGLSFASLSDLPKIIYSIFDEGLISKDNGGIVSNCEMIGTTDNYDTNRLLNYAYQETDGLVANIIVDIPIVLESNHKKYFVGPFIKSDEFQKYNNDVNSIWFNQYVNDKKLLPTEFIVGVTIYDTKNNNILYYDNPNYYNNVNDFQKNFTIGKIIADSKDKNIIEIDEDNINECYQRITNMIDLYNKFQKNTYYLEQAKKYIEDKYLNTKKH